jgi:excisionase family DNA binding protein
MKTSTMKFDSPREAARKLGYTLKYVYDLLYADRIVGARKVGRRWLIPETSIKARLDKRGQGNA